MAHWRRKFIEAKDEDRLAGWFLLQMRHLYVIERRLREQKASAKERERIRAVESRPIWKRMRRYLERIESKVLPASRLRKALAYGKNLWDALTKLPDMKTSELEHYTPEA